MATYASTASPAKLDFDRRVEETIVPKSDINLLILDYLTMEGFPQAAENFSREANLPLQCEPDFIQTRQQISNFIHSGQIEDAISALNEIDPKLLDEDKALHFALLRLQLVELIRACNDGTGDQAEAIAFASEHLGPRANLDPRFLEDLERTMALLLLSPDSLEPQIAHLLTPEFRRSTADSVNTAVLERRMGRKEAAIRALLHMRAWAENKARHVPQSTLLTNLPDKIDIGLRGDQTSSQNYLNPTTGDDRMVNG